MQRTVLRGKIHRATVTQADLHYEGSVTIDRDLLVAAGIWVHERIEVYNVSNGSRFATYAIEGAAGSGVICINGAAAHLSQPGDLVIICAYGTDEEENLIHHTPKVVLVNEKNQIKEIHQKSGHPLA